MSIEKGLVGEQPSLDKMQKVLSEMDTYIYCGHGDGRKNLPTQEIEKMPYYKGKYFARIKKDNSRVLT